MKKNLYYNMAGVWSQGRYLTMKLSLVPDSPTYVVGIVFLVSVSFKEMGIIFTMSLVFV